MYLIFTIPTHKHNTRRVDISITNFTIPRWASLALAYAMAMLDYFVEQEEITNLILAPSLLLGIRVSFPSLGGTSVAGQSETSSYLNSTKPEPSGKGAC